MVKTLFFGKGIDIFLLGTILKGVGGLYYVRGEDSKLYECRARGIFRKDKTKPMIGDRVIFEPEEPCGVITELLKRSSELVRPRVANIDTLIVATAVKAPSPDFLLIDKLFLTAQMRGITPVLCITKTDLAECDEIYEIYKNTGYKIFRVSSHKNSGIDEIKEFLKGRTTAFAGLSGVGKSSLLNLIIDKELQTGEISEKISRGKHTTRHVELFEIDGGGFVLDTPGFSSFEPEMLEPSELGTYFPEMTPFIDNCRFKGCLHINEPDCAVKMAVDEGVISRSRYENYCKIYSVIKDYKKWEL